MHIPDNYLGPVTCAALSVVSLPPLAVSISKVRLELKENRELAPMLGVGASLSFLMMMFNVPIPGGTTAHAIGGVLLAVLMGPYAASLCVSVALILQAFLFGDGGILSLGANIFNMAILMPFSGYTIYDLLRKRGHSYIGAGAGAFLGINIAAFFTAIELGIQPIIASSNGLPLYNPYPISVTIPAMMIPHIVIAGWVEVFFTVVIYRFVNIASPDAIYSEKNVSKGLIGKLYGLILFLVIITPIGLLASGTAFGEWSGEELLEKLQSSNTMAALPTGMANGIFFNSLFTDYEIPGINVGIGYVLSAVTAVLLFFIFAKLIGSMYDKSDIA